MPHSPSLLTVRNKIGLSLQASKWLKCPLLIDVDEMRALLNALGNFWIFLISGVIDAGKELLSQVEFLDCYQCYIESLKQGKLLDDERRRFYFSSVFTVTTEALYALPVSDQRLLVKVDKPVVQLQSHQFTYSAVDGKFRSMVFGTDHISWGIQFSYPQLYQDSLMQVRQVREGSEFPNTTLFHSLQRWMRQYTVATPFWVNHRRTNVPIRLGKNCFEWINNHPQLISKNLQVKNFPN